MLLTEEQARTKWCPHSRYNSNGELASNRWKQSAPEDQPHALNPVPCRCIASECMAWRMHTLPHEFSMDYANAKWLVDGDENYEFVTNDGREGGLVKVRQIAANGFCGLAGKVE